MVWAALQDDIVLLNLDTGVYFSLDGVGRRFWELLSEGVAVDAMLQRLNDEYEVEAAVLRMDLDSLVRQLTAEGLIAGAE